MMIPVVYLVSKHLVVFIILIMEFGGPFDIANCRVAYLTYCWKSELTRTDQWSFIPSTVFLVLSLIDMQPMSASSIDIVGLDVV